MERPLAQEGHREAAFGDVLASTLLRVVDFLKFAEAKNAALLTFASAWMLGSIALLASAHSPSGIVGNAFRAALLLFAMAAVTALWSLLPKVDLRRLHRDPVQEKSLLFFGDVAGFDTLEYETRVGERYMPEEGQSVTDKYLHDLSVQISVNSRLAKRKYKLFNVGAWVVLIALAVIAVALLSATINRWTGGAILWA
jgi:hypothetical protein